jgi:Tfp pilus assembly protein PilF
MKQKKENRENQKHRKEKDRLPQKSNYVANVENTQFDVYKKYQRLFIAVIFGIGIIIYSNSFNCSFHFDDNNVFTKSVTKASSTIMDWLRLFPSRPIGAATFALNYHFHKLDVWGYHFVNLMIHLFNAFLVWWLTRLTLSTPIMKDETISKYKTLMAFLTGILFVSRPLATQSVTYIAQRFASLATMFYILSLILYAQGRLWQGKKNIAWLLFGGSIISAVSGMLTKEIVFTLPFAIILYEYCFLKISPWKIEIKDKNIYIPLVILGIFILIFLINFSPLSVFNSVQPVQGYTYSISAKEYLLTQFNVIVTYLRLFILPIHQNLDYDYPVSSSLLEINTLFCFSLVLGILVLGILLFRKYRLISFGIFWFFLTISVESSIIPISQNVIFEHRTYLPSFGCFLALTGAFFYFFKERYLAIGVTIILMFSGVNSVLSYQRNKIWKNEYTLWADCFKKSPHKARVNDNLGVALADQGKYPEAIYYYKNAIKLNPDYEDAYYNLANAFKDTGKMEEAAKNFRETIRINPNFADAHNNLGIILEMYYKKYDEAIYNYRQELKIQPDNSGVYFNIGIALAAKGERQEAIKHFQQAIYLKPDYEAARQRLRMTMDEEQKQTKR